MNRVLLTLALATFAYSRASAQEAGSIHGRLSDPVHHQLVRNATVSVVMEGVEREAAVDRNGEFTFIGVPSGNVMVAIVAGGYRPLSVQTCVPAGETRMLDLFVARIPSVVKGPYFGNLPYLRDYDRHNELQARSRVFNATFDRYDVGGC